MQTRVAASPVIVQTVTVYRQSIRDRHINGNKYLNGNKQFCQIHATTKFYANLFPKRITVRPKLFLCATLLQTFTRFVSESNLRTDCYQYFFGILTGSIFVFSIGIQIGLSDQNAACQHFRICEMPPASRNFWSWSPFRFNAEDGKAFTCQVFLVS